MADPEALRGYGLISTIPRRRDSTVHGLVFASNLVLHSGVDDEHGHFVAAYGIETDASESAPLRLRGIERAEHSVAQLALSSPAKTLVTVDPLPQLTGSTRTATAVRKRKVVEDEQLAGSQVHLDFDVRDAEAMLLEERDFGADAVELRATEKTRVSLHARKTWRACRCAFNDARETSLHITASIVPGAVRPAVGDQSTEQLGERRPRALA